MTFKLTIIKQYIKFLLSREQINRNKSEEGKGEVPHLWSYVAYQEECSEGCSAL